MVWVCFFLQNLWIFVALSFSLSKGILRILFKNVMSSSPSPSLKSTKAFFLHWLSCSIFWMILISIELMNPWSAVFIRLFVFWLTLFLSSFMGMLPPSSEVSTLMSSNLLMNLSLLMTLAEFTLFFAGCLLTGVGPLVVVDMICSTSLSRSFFCWYRMHDLFEFRRYYFFCFDKLVAGFLVWLLLCEYMGGLFKLLKCWVFVLDSAFVWLLSYLFPNVAPIYALVFPSVFNLLGRAYSWSGRVSRMLDFFLVLVFLLCLFFFIY